MDPPKKSDLMYLNNVGALFELKRKKMLEKEVAKLEGQMVLLEQQRIMI